MSQLGDAGRELDDVDRRITALEHDIGQCASLPAATLSEWSTWRQNARSYLLSAHRHVDALDQALQVAGAAGIIGLGAAETYTEHEAALIHADTAKVSAELGTWQQRVAAQGCSLSTPGAPPGWDLPWTTIAVVLGALGVAGVLTVVVMRRASASSIARSLPRASVRRRARRRLAAAS